MAGRKHHLGLVPPRAEAPATDEDGPPDDPAASPAASIDEAFRRYAPLVASLGLKMTAHPGDIDDLVQEVFLRATRGIAGLRNPRATKAWLMTITINVARQRLRRRKLRRLVGLDQPTDYAELADPTLSPEQRLTVGRVYAALDRLPVNQRLAWVLRHVEGESLEAVALLCDCSLATAKRRIAAAQKVVAGVIG